MQTFNSSPSNNENSRFRIRNGSTVKKTDPILIQNSRNGSLNATTVTSPKENQAFSMQSRRNYLESAIYKPANYYHNTNYNREFENKRKSEGLKLIKELKHPGKFFTITGEEMSASQLDSPERM